MIRRGGGKAAEAGLRDEDGRLALPALSEDWEDAIEAVPSFPESARRLMKAAGSGASGQEIGKILGSDPVLCARVLRAANSPFYGLSRPVSGPEQAAAILGVKALSGIASACFLGSMSGAKALPAGFDSKGFVKHGLVCACLAGSGAGKMGMDLDPQEAFCAGLFHDLGVLVIAAHSRSHPEKHRGPPDLTGTLSTDFHSEFGALLARRWNLPESLVEAVALHHRPDGGGDLARLCWASSLLSDDPRAPLEGWAAFDEGQREGWVSKAAAEAEKLFASMGI